MMVLILKPINVLQIESQSMTTMIKLNTDRFARIIFDSYLRVSPKKIKVQNDYQDLEDGKDF